MCVCVCGRQQNCYKLVYAAGVQRIVTRRACLHPQHSRHMREVAGIEFVHLEETPAVLAALDVLLARHLASRAPADVVQEQADIAQQRQKRKLAKAALREKRKKTQKDEEMQS